MREWLLVLKGDGKSPKTIEKYRESVRLLGEFLAGGNFPLFSNVTAEHLREWLGALRAVLKIADTAGTSDTAVEKGISATA